MSRHYKESKEFIDGFEQLRNKAWDKAIKHFSKAMKEYGDYDTPPELFFKRGLAYNGKGWFDEAIKDFKTALGLGSHTSEIFANMAKSYRAKGWFDEAIDYLGVALERENDQADYHYIRGLAYFDKGWFNEAIEHFLQAAHLDSKDSRFPYATAVALRCSGQLDEAKRFLKKAVKSGGERYVGLFEKGADCAEVDLKVSSKTSKISKKVSDKKIKSTTKVTVGSVGGSMLDAAYRILDTSGTSLHYKEITKKALAKKLIETTGATPEQSMRTAISRDISSKGKDARFRRDPVKGKGYYRLT